MNRQQDVDRFYEALATLRKKCGGFRRLGQCDQKHGWPERGVYFFFTDDEFRSNGQDLRVVRVGTHAVSLDATTTLWSRLRTHRGSRNGVKGNQRGSIFRRRVGSALMNRDGWGQPILDTWNVGSHAPREVRLAELPLEREVSSYIGQMPFLWLNVGDPPSPKSHRKIIEKNSIALLSNLNRDPIDPPSDAWLGLRSDQLTILQSGLWNSDHVDEAHDPLFLDLLERYIGAH